MSDINNESYSVQETCGCGGFIRVNTIYMDRKDAKSSIRIWRRDHPCSLRQTVTGSVNIVPLNLNQSVLEEFVIDMARNPINISTPDAPIGGEHAREVHEYYQQRLESVQAYITEEANNVLERAQSG